MTRPAGPPSRAPRPRSPRVPAPGGALLLALAIVLASGTAGRAEEPAAPVPLLPEQQRWNEILAHVRPSEAESAWRSVGWLPTFGDAVAKAREEGRPIFLWAMNGHPLACV